MVGRTRTNNSKLCSLKIRCVFALVWAGVAHGLYYVPDKNERVVVNTHDYIEIDIVEDYIPMAKPDRKLSERLDNIKTKANLCLDCITDPNKIFCPGTNFHDGLCCGKGETCPPGSTQLGTFILAKNWCSNYNDHIGFIPT